VVPPQRQFAEDAASLPEMPSQRLFAPAIDAKEEDESPSLPTSVVICSSLKADLSSLVLQFRIFGFETRIVGEQEFNSYTGIVPDKIVEPKFVCANFAPSPAMFAHAPSFGVHFVLLQPPRHVFDSRRKAVRRPRAKGVKAMYNVFESLRLEEGWDVIYGDEPIMEIASSLIQLYPGIPGSKSSLSSERRANCKPS
jgi:hypothetical protein